MRTTLVLDNKLISQAMKFAGVKTKREAVDIALHAFVLAGLRPDVRKIYGIGGFDPAYHYKKLRKGVVK